MIEHDNEMSRSKRAGDVRRVLTALLFHHDRDTDALGRVMHEAAMCGRGHHFTYCLLERLEQAYDLDNCPERIEQIRRAIAQFTAIEDGLIERENDE